MLSPPPPSQRQQTPVANADRYARAALLSAKERVACAPEGSRNHALNAEAFSLARLVANGRLSRGEIELHMREAALAAGLSAHEAEATITSALRARRHHQTDELMGADRGAAAMTASRRKQGGATCCDPPTRSHYRIPRMPSWR